MDFEPSRQVSCSKSLQQLKLAALFTNAKFTTTASLCMAANSSDNGAPVFITSCSDTTSQKVWTLPQIGHGNSGRYALAFGPGGTAPIKCLDVTDGQDGQAAPGTKLQLWDCTTDHDISQGFLPTGVIAWQASGFNGLCVDLTDGIKNKGNQVGLSQIARS
ncbi:hypothetical protein BDN70DRAFT_874844 [Pholiota conissans]|uniref:Ricin B lectin domain-containing protein n=1 Tax=Pholiota conissans TaxID=109636 RepID=A0A9P5Z9Y2_9AGAR|nr:hypothetical protein BDN70DRAFT_874844 [Pholiota conissans]